MRRCALFGVLLMLSGCSGSLDFFGDAHSTTWNPNRPIGDSENMRRVRGLGPQLPPLATEAGNVWPGPVPPEPTLSDLEHDTTPLGSAPNGTTTEPAAPDHRQPRPQGSSTPPGNTQPGLTVPQAGPIPQAPPSSVPGAGPTGRVYQTPQGPAVGTRTQGRIDTLSGPGRNGSIVVPNGNGTSTIIGPDGSISTVPTPK